MKYQYILDKIQSANLIEAPFPHLEIENLFEDSDFEMITQSFDIKVSPATSDENLLDILFSNGYRIIEFPGCTENHKEYLEWHSKKSISRRTNTACEGFGIVLRQESPKSESVRSLMKFLESPEFIACLAEKFGIDKNDCNYDCGIQKYLDGYEISPHPDIRRKALTYMVNINPNSDSHLLDHHTHYLRFKSEFDYVSSYWKGNPKIDTCWVPWEWCTTHKQQTRNNSMVIFSPSFDTLHGVKANYDHLNNQRTQLYGNLWYKNNPATNSESKWENLIIKNSLPSEQKLTSKIGNNYRRIRNKILGKNLNRSEKTHSNRHY